MNAGTQMIGGLAASPPHIRFERRAVERRDPAELGGASRYVDVDFAFITPHGSKDTVEKAWDAWFPQVRESVRQGRFPQTWLDAYRASYEAWKNDQAPPLHGTDIRNWPAISPAEIKRLVDMRVMTIEVLAEANESLLENLGMGARALKQKAIDYLAAKKDITPMVQELAALRAQIAGLEHRLTAVTSRAQIAEEGLLSARTQPARPYIPEPETHPAAADNTASLIDEAIDEAL